MKQTKHFKRTALSKSAKSMVSLMLLLIAMLMPQGAWAANHYDAGYGSWTSTHDADGVKFKITALRMYNYQGNNSQFRSNPEVNVVAEGKTHTFYLGSLTGNTGKDTFYYNGEGNENPYKGSGSFSKVTYDQTQNDIRVKAYFNNQKNDQKVTTNPDKNYKDNGNGSGKWCTADLTIEIYAHTCTKVTIAGNWGDYSDGINKTESYSWTFNLGHTSTVVQTTPATCAATGLRKSNCSCGAAIEEVLPIDPNAHNYDKYGLCTHNNEHFQVPTGEGTATSPYLVKNIGNLYWLSDQVAKTSNNSFHARQIDDITASDDYQYCVSIGCTLYTIDHPFCGTYDGGGYVIKNLYAGEKGGVSYSYKGLLFGITENATIKNVGIVNANYNVLNDDAVRYSVLCGYAKNCTISNCFVVGTIYNNKISPAQTGAVCGQCSFSTLSGCYTSDDKFLVGFIYERSTFEKCYSRKGKVDAVSRTSGEISTIDHTKIEDVDDYTCGAVCYKMNEGKTDGTQTWYQNLGSEPEGFARPKKNTAYTVYKVKGYKCDGVTQKDSYSNNSSATPVDAHSFASDFTIDVKETCTNAGSKSKHCAKCSAKTEVTSIPILNHQMIEHAATAVKSCAEPGNLKYYTCSQSCCSGKYYKDNGLHTTNAYANKEATVLKKPHTFGANDLTQNECTVCHHGFFYYTSDKNAVIEPYKLENLKDAKGNSLTIISNTNVDGKGVMEFNKPLANIGKEALYNANFTGDLTIPNTVTTIGDLALADLLLCKGKLTIPNSVKSIGMRAFYRDQFTGDLTIPNSVETIEEEAFSLCSLLDGKLTISNSVKTIGEYAFYYVDDFTSAEMHSIPQVGRSAFSHLYCNDKKLVLSDDSYVYNGGNSNFPGMDKVTYTRKGIKNQWGTIVVPFEVDGSGDDYDLYTITRVTADKLSLTPVEGTLAAGTPAVICLKDGLAGNYNLTLTAANNAVNSDGTLQGSSANGLQLVGTYAATQLSANDYFIANNKFWRAGDMSATVKAAPFRAYLKNTTGSAMASALNIAVEDDSATAIDVLNMLNDADTEYYDLNGRRIPQLQKGVNIVKYGNGKTVKVNIK